MSRFNPTAEELEQGRTGPQFSNVTAAQVFSKTADAGLASRIHATNKIKYWSLKQQWEYETNIVKRPDGYYGE
jgi:hypothetical protein